MSEISNNERRKKPLFALTLGDPAGIGPEIALKAFRNSSFTDSVVVVGDAAILRDEAANLQMDCNICSISETDAFIEGVINILDCGILTPQSCIKGIAQKTCGIAAFQYIERAIELALQGKVDGVITNPINKEALSLAGINYPGHTEIFAEKTSTQHYSMLFFLRNVGVAHVTTHCSLKDAISAISAKRVLEHIELLNGALKKMGFEKPRIAVSGLNPHAGEGGLFGDEEIHHIIPAITEAKKNGMEVAGPFPPDTVFMRAFKGEFDGVVSMLHDHGFVALKTMDFQHGVNITIGLPIIRTSVGHGTAFEISGQGKADESSLLSAFDAAMKLYANKVSNAT